MPLDRRRRARRRSIGPLVLAVVAVAVVLFIVIGGIAFMGRASAPYRRSVNRSFADQGSVLVDGGNQSAVQLRKLMATMPTLLRRSSLSTDR